MNFSGSLYGTKLRSFIQSEFFILTPPNAVFTDCCSYWKNDKESETEQNKTNQNKKTTYVLLYIFPLSRKDLLSFLREDASIFPSRTGQSNARRWWTLE